MQRRPRCPDTLLRYFHTSLLRDAVILLLKMLVGYSIGILLIELGNHLAGRPFPLTYRMSRIVSFFIITFILLIPRRKFFFYFCCLKDLRKGNISCCAILPTQLKIDRQHTFWADPDNESLEKYRLCGDIRYLIIDAKNGEFLLSAWREDAMPPDGPVPEGVTFEVEYLENTRVITAITHSPAENEEQQEWLDKFRECFKQYFE